MSDRIDGSAVDRGEYRPRTAVIDGIVFPLHSTKPGHCDRPEGVADGVVFCPRLANNVLFLNPPSIIADALPGWRHVGAQPRWNHIAGRWSAHDASLQRKGQHRWWGPRDHLRVWHAPDGSHAIGQAHAEDWRRWPRRHRILGLDPARDHVAKATASAGLDVRLVAVGSSGPGHDGRVLVVRPVG